MKRKKNLGYKVVEHIPTASIKMIKELQEKKGVDEVFVCDPSLSDEEMEKLNDYCQIHNIAYRLMPTSLQTTQFSIALFGGEPVLEFHNTPLDGWGKIIKRTTDMIASTILIILVSPIMAIVALAIWIEDRKGPIVYKNERIGSNGQKFLVYKFRYMLWKHSIHKDNPHLEEAIALEKKLIRERNVRKGALYKIKDDPRKSRIGRVIERYSIDELPQLFNVWKGQMSLVGPRPHQEREVQKYREYHRRLLTIKPGITGMAQVAGRSDLDFEDEYKLDVYYIENWSLLLDIRILFRTILVLFRRRKNN